MPWYEYRSTEESPTKEEITPEKDNEKGRIDTDGGTALEILTTEGWEAVINHDGGIFYPTIIQIEALSIVDNGYRFRIQKTTKPDTNNVKAYNFHKDVYENSFYAAS